MLVNIVKYGSRPSHPIFYAIWCFALLAVVLAGLLLVMISHPAWASGSEMAKRIPWFLRKQTPRSARMQHSLRPWHHQHDPHGGHNISDTEEEQGGEENSKHLSPFGKALLATTRLRRSPKGPPAIPFRLSPDTEKLRQLPWLPQFRNATEGIETVTMPDGSTRDIYWHVLSAANPRALIINHSLTADEAKSIIMTASPSLARSAVISGNHGENAVNSIRSSTGMFLINGQEQIELPANRALRFVTRHFGGLLEDNWIEATQVLRYDGAAGQRYVPHNDFYSPQDEANLGRGGQRIFSVLTWLNEVEAGGETTFPNANIKVKPQYLNSIMFYDCDEHMNPDPYSMHGGDAPAKGSIKYVAVNWVHPKTFV